MLCGLADLSKALNARMLPSEQASALHGRSTVCVRMWVNVRHKTFFVWFSVYKCYVSVVHLVSNVTKFRYSTYSIVVQARPLLFLPTLKSVMFSAAQFMAHLSCTAGAYRLLLFYSYFCVTEFVHHCTVLM